ncbi:class I SAM-dependent methyltransferase [Nonomuraea sp. NPDC050394]|uniref:class I SAM-dependent methyltransferase n=1 Tax=Nonomuraea sp. NPDC050394 TaxID=3364363 RepID=UPI0037A8D5B9
MTLVETPVHLPSSYGRLSGIRRIAAAKGTPLLLGLLATSAPITAYEGAVMAEEAMLISGGLLVRLRESRRRLARLIYDQRFGVHTADFADLEEFGLGHPDRVHYSPAHWGTLCRALPVQEVGRKDVFLDLGSGKGRMVLEAASRFAFRRVIGVELSPELVTVARDNVASTRLKLQAREIEFVNTDVLDYDIPPDVSVVFLNNPFRGEIFAAAMKRLIESADRYPRPITLIYFNPIEEPHLLGTGRFRHVRTVMPRWRSANGVFGTTRVYALA